MHVWCKKTTSASRSTNLLVITKPIGMVLSSGFTTANRHWELTLNDLTHFGKGLLVRHSPEQTYHYQTGYMYLGTTCQQAWMVHEDLTLTFHTYYHGWSAVIWLQWNSLFHCWLQVPNQNKKERPCPWSESHYISLWYASVPMVIIIYGQH